MTKIKTPTTTFSNIRLTGINNQERDEANFEEDVIIYNTDIEGLQINRNDSWRSINSSRNEASGVGLINSTPWMIPIGNKAEVEVAENEYAGFMYIENIIGPTSSIRMFNGTSWVELALKP